MIKKKKSEAPAAGVEIKTITRNLKCVYSVAERSEKGQELSFAHRLLMQQQDDKKRVSDDHKARISETEAKISRLADAVSDGYEFRDIACEVRISDPKGRKTIIRKDIGEIVGVEDLDEIEAQIAMFPDPTLEPGTTNVGEILAAAGVPSHVPEPESPDAAPAKKQSSKDAVAAHAVKKAAKKPAVKK